MVGLRARENPRARVEVGEVGVVGVVARARRRRREVIPAPPILHYWPPNIEIEIWPLMNTKLD